MGKRFSKFKRVFGAGVFAFALTVAALVQVPFAHAAAPVVTWTGAGDGVKFSDKANWKDAAGAPLAAAPAAGDVLQFNTAPTATDSSGYHTVNLTNDLTTTAFGGVTIVGQGTAGGSYNIAGKLQLADGATLSSDSYGLYAYFNDGVQGAGALNVVGYWSLYNSQVSGQLSLDKSYSYISSIKGVTMYVLSGYTTLYVDESFATPITTTSGASASLSVRADVDYDTSTYKATTYTISGNLTLGSDLRVYVSDQATAKFTGTITGSGKVTRDPSSGHTGVLKVGDKSIVNPVKTTTLSGTKDEYYSVYDGDTAILDGTRTGIGVGSGGILEGNGTITDYLYVDYGGTVSPGHSPGKITVQNDLSLYQNSTYVAQILDKSHYDQLVAKTVSLDGANLDLQFLKGGKVSKGDTFTIINNTGTDPVDGTFANLKEGARIAIGKAIFAISYKGGTGNDVVLTALVTSVAPGTPNTGVQIIAGNPVLVAAFGLVGALALAMVVRRQLQK